MLGLKRVSLMLFVLVVAALVVVFVLENQQSVSLAMFGWSISSVPLAIPIIMSLLLGLAIGPLLGACVVVRARRRRGAGA